MTPFYTHMGADNKEHAILVNRGWVPLDLKDQRMHQAGMVSGKLSGVLYQGDLKHKYSTVNNPSIQHYANVTPYDFALISQLANQEEASQMMLHQIDFDANKRQLLPTVPTVEELTHFRISAERHAAYEGLWRMVTFAGIFANTAVWLYL